MGHDRALYFVLTLLLWALSTVTARGQTVPGCPRGGGLLTPAVVGSLIMREGGGLGVVTIASTAADVERAWGPPTDCRSQQRGFSYNYYLTADGGQTGLLIVVLIHNGAVERILATLLPHSGGVGPALRTGRGVSLGAPIDDVRRAYGDPGNPAAREWIYVSDGVAFYQSGGRVGSILIFNPGAPPPDRMR